MSWRVTGYCTACNGGNESASGTTLSDDNAYDVCAVPRDYYKKYDYVTVSNAGEFSGTYKIVDICGRPKTVDIFIGEYDKCPCDRKVGAIKGCSVEFE